MALAVWNGKLSGFLSKTLKKYLILDTLQVVNVNCKTGIRVGRSGFFCAFGVD